MKINYSPWLTQVNHDRAVNNVWENRKTDVAIIGAGIAGMTTAYYALKNTSHKVILIEADRVARGATGHNAGQLTSYFERQLSDLVKEFGIDKATKAQAFVDSAWELLEELFAETNLQTPFAQFTGYAGCQDLEEILIHLENNRYANATHINSEPFMVAEESGIADQIPDKYDGLYSVVPHKNILELLETEDPRFIAALTARKGVMNSALFCEELLDYLFKIYPDRFTLFEHSPVTDIELYEDHAILKVLDYEIKAAKVVLCTNGFEKFTITNKVGDDIDAKFHQLISGRIGYMAGYLEEHSRSPIAISYLPKTNNKSDSTDLFDPDPYIYLTRRTFEGEENQVHSLVCVGGPELLVDDTSIYSKKEHDYPDEAHAQIDEFLHQSYKFSPKGEIDYKFKWHGLMGYTPNGVRCVGPEPINPVLIYNIGCNGIGIMPSIASGNKISRILNGEELEPSIFDPRDSRQKKK